MAELRHEVPAAGGEERRIRYVGRPPNARRNGVGSGDRAQTARMRHFRLAGLRQFEGSDYIIDRELEIARERAGQGRNSTFLSAAHRADAESGTGPGARPESAPRDAKPFSGYPLAERNQHMSDAADEIASIATEIVARKEAAAPSTNRRRSAGLRPHQRPARDRLRTAGRARRGAEAPRRGLERRKTKSSRSSPRAGRASRRWSTNG